MITYCIPSKNNLRYLKNSIESIKNHTTSSEIIVFVDSDNDGTKKWLKNNNIEYIENTSSEPKGIAYGYNKCIEKSSKDIVCMFHADMYMAEGFEANLLKHLKNNTIVSATRIEPPLHPEGKEKIVKSFGMYPEDFNISLFNNFSKNLLTENLNKTTNGIFAPWICYKNDIKSIFMHDEYFHSYHEDSDIFQRFILKKFKIIQSWDSLVYHFTCRGGQFQDGIEKVTSDEKFHTMKNRSAKHFIRKWGHWIENNEYSHPVIHKKYDIGVFIKNCKEEFLPYIEPLFSSLYVDNKIRENYIKEVQPGTPFNMKMRVKDKEVYFPTNDIIISFDGSKLTNERIQILCTLPKMIEDSGEVGKMEFDIFNIQINKLKTYESLLINLNDSYYQNQLKNKND